MSSGEDQSDDSSDDDTGFELTDSQWKMLHDYIEAFGSPDDIELIENNTKVQYSLGGGRNIMVSVNELHNLIFKAVNCKRTHPSACNFLQNIIEMCVEKAIDKDDIVNLSQHLSLTNKNGVSVTVTTVSPSLKQLLQDAVDGKYKQQEKGDIEVRVTDCDGEITQQNIYAENITNVQAILALVIVLRCYPKEWWDEFFWDAWLAVTIQLGMLEKVDGNLNNEVFPCLWMKQVFVAERLVGNPNSVYCLLMGQDPSYIEKPDKGIYLRAATGIAFHNIRDATEGMTTEYGLDCTGDWPIQYCKQGLLLVNMIRCIPKNGKSMADNPYYDAWFVYTLKLSRCFGEKGILIMCNKSHSPNLVEYIQKVASNSTSVWHPTQVKHEHIDDKNKFYKIVFNPKLPTIWNILQDYINSLSITVVKYYGKCDSDIVDIDCINGRTRQVKIDVLHKLILTAIKSDSSDTQVGKFLNAIIQDNIWKMLHINVQQISQLAKNLSFKKNELEITVDLSESLIQLLDAVNEKYNKCKSASHSVTIKIDSILPTQGNPSQLNQLSTIHEISTFSCTITDVQAILALVVVLKHYPRTWYQHFFWDAWLAITIQLGLLKEVDNDFNNEVFPCQWLKLIFEAEQLVGSPEEVKHLILGQDPISKNDIYEIYTLRGSTGIAFHNIERDHESIIRITQNYDLDCRGEKPVELCKNGTLLVNMIRCIHKGDDPMIYNTCYDAWFMYTLKLTKYFGEEAVPIVVMCTTFNDFLPNLVKHIKTIYPNTQTVQHPTNVVSIEDRVIMNNFLPPTNQPTIDTTINQFRSGNSINWEMLQDYIQAIPNDIEKELGIIKDQQYFEFKRDQHSNENHRVQFNDFQNEIVRAVHSTNSTDVTQFLNNILGKCFYQHMLHTNAKQIDDISGHLSYEDDLKVEVTIPNLLKTVLQEAADNGSYKQQNEVHMIQRNCGGNQEVSDVQAILALVITLKCYPLGWQRYLFWDAWLAVTVQLGLLRRVVYDNNTKNILYNINPNIHNEVVPCDWMHKIFYAEWLVKSPKNVRGILMGVDPISKLETHGRSVMHQTTGIAFHNIGNKNKSISGMRKKYRLDCDDDKPIRYCERNGLLLVNMIRCICIHDNSAASTCRQKNTCTDAWVLYTVKLAKYFSESDSNIPVVVTTNNQQPQFIPRVVGYMKCVNHGVRQVRHPCSIVQDDDKTVFRRAFESLGILRT